MTKAEAIDNFSFFNEGDYITREMEESADIVLNLIQEQQHIIEGKEALIDTMAHNEEVLEWVIEKKNKIIDEMAKWLCEDDTVFGYGGLKGINTPEKIKEYFRNKVEKEV